MQLLDQNRIRNRDMQTNEELRTKYGIELHMVESYHPVPIIRIPGGDPDLGVEDFGEMAAVTACIQLKVKDQQNFVSMLHERVKSFTFK